jgi:hypothetical protein
MVCCYESRYVKRLIKSDDALRWEGASDAKQAPRASWTGGAELQVIGDRRTRTNDIVPSVNMVQKVVLYFPVAPDLHSTYNQMHT